MNVWTKLHDLDWLESKVKGFLSCLVTSDQDVEHDDLPNGNTAEPAGDGEEMTVAVTRRTKRKRRVDKLSRFVFWKQWMYSQNVTAFSLISAGRKAKVTEHHSNDLGAEDDDIIADAQSPIPQHSLFSAPHGHSQPVGRVFVERNSECDTAAAVTKSRLVVWTTRRRSLVVVILLTLICLCVFLLHPYINKFIRVNESTPHQGSCSCLCPDFSQLTANDLQSATSSKTDSLIYDCVTWSKCLNWGCTSANISDSSTLHSIFLTKPLNWSWRFKHI